jgi:hypothetical protein
MMPDNSIQLESSREYQRLADLFFGKTPPFSKQDVYDFNQLYRIVYPGLPRHEKWQAEWLVDMIIDRIEDPDLAKLIYGVV